jgi:hypothetical protein
VKKKKKLNPLEPFEIIITPEQLLQFSLPEPIDEEKRQYLIDLETFETFIQKEIENETK